MRDETVARHRILVVEDEAMIALVIEDTLQDMGYEVVGLCGRLATALRLAKDEKLDAAILDVSIRDEKVYPVAEQLRARGIPFVLASGYGDWALPANFRDQPRLTKPFTTEELAELVRGLWAHAT